MKETMKHCKHCGYATRSIKKMGDHYRKKHPGAMKRRVHHERSVAAVGHSGYAFCPHCGGKL